MKLDDPGPLDFDGVVPFVPFRCPRCGKNKPLTYAVRGRLRYHLCRACGCKYRSRELAASEIVERSELEAAVRRAEADRSPPKSR